MFRTKLYLLDSIHLIITKPYSMLFKMIPLTRCLYSALRLTLLIIFLTSVQSSAVAKTDIIIASDNKSLRAIDFVSLYFQHIQEQLSNQINFTELLTSTPREWRLLTELPNVCLYNKLRNSEREQISIFSKYPISVFPPVRLLSTNTSGLDKNVSLTQLLKNKNLSIGAVSGRAYGKKIDEEIKRLADTHSANLTLIGGSLATLRVRNMFIQGKFDAIIEYASAFRDHLKTTKSSVKNLSTHQLDNAQQFVHGYIACSKTQQGTLAIDVLNKS